MKTKRTPVAALWNLRLLGLCLAFGSGGIAITLATEPASTASTRIMVRAEGQGAPWIKLRAGTDISAPGSAPANRALALASADFDEDGVPDLVTGYAGAEGGGFSMQRGNVDAIYPNSSEAQARRQRGEFNTAAFLPGAKSFAVPEAADLIGAGDFDADGHWDVVTARTGGSKLYWLRGDGRGNFEPVQTIELTDAVTALATGEVNRADGLTDIVVGIVTGNGAHALVFEAPEGALRRAPESFSLAAPANSIVVGQLDSEAANDIAIAAGNEVIIVKGRDRKLSQNASKQAEVSAAEISRTTLDSAVTSLAIGDFAGDSRQELAALTSDGNVRVFDQGMAARSSDGMTLQVASETGTASRRLLAAKISALPKADLLVFGGSSALQILTTREADVVDRAGTLTSSGRARLSTATAVSAESEVTAVLPMRLNADALSDLVLLNKESDAPAVIESVSSIYVVNATGNTNDKTPGNAICEDDAGNCTFSAAIQEANAHLGADTINFNLPGAGPHVISPNFGQSLDETVTVDGTTQPIGRVEIVANGFFPLQFYGANSVLRGISTYGSGTAIFLLSDGNIVEGNYIGFRADGTKPIGYGTSGSGISFRGGINSSRFGNNNLIGGTVAQARNVISNCDIAISLSGNTGNIFRGNYIGTTVDGTAALPNRYAFFVSDSDLTVGGTVSGAGNVISGTTQVVLTFPKSALVQGNHFGTTADGTQPLSNGGIAIDIGTNEPVTIGGTSAAARNLISGSTIGIRVQHDSGGGTLIQGNYIGTNAPGSGAIPNTGPGLQLSGTRGVLIGGAAAGAGNLISGNVGNGIELIGGINGTPCRTVVIQGNRVGTDSTGTVALPNHQSGMQLAAVDNVKLGGTTAEERNLISGNIKHGLILGNATANPCRIQGNRIGVNIFGTGALGNGQHGIHIDNFGGHFIGGNAAGAGNIIAFNGGAGIASSFRDFLGGAILSNSIFANRGLGLDRVGDGVTPYRGSYSEAPVITSVNTSGSETVISGHLRTQTFGPQGPYTIQFFSNTSSDPTGYGEGQTFIGETTINAGQLATAPFSATITPAVSAGRYISAVAIGVHDTQNNGGPLTSEFSFNVRAPGDPRNNPLQVFALTPSIGGDTGLVTVKLLGEGIREGATVLLRRAGQADIVGTVVSISGDGSSVDATFNLAGQPRGGGYEIVVSNADGSSSSLANAFTVEQGRRARVFVDLTGPPQIRVGGPARYFLTYGNTGNVDAEASLVRVFVPAGYEIGPRQRLEDGSFPAVLPSEGETVVQFFLSQIAPGANSTVVQVRADPASTEETALRAAVISSPAFRAPASAQVDPTVQLEYQLLESRDDYEKTEIRVTTPTVSGSLIREITRRPVSQHQDLFARIVETEDQFEHTYIYTLPQSVLDPVAVARALRREDRPAGASGGGPRSAAALSAGSIRPNKGGGTITTTVYGQGLHSGMNVKLSRAGESDVFARGVSAVREGTSALVYFDLRQVPLGVWSVEVIGSDGSTSRLDDAFTVEPAFVEVQDTTTGGSGTGGDTAREINDAAQNAAQNKNTKPIPSPSPGPASPTPPPPPPPRPDQTVKPRKPGPDQTNREIKKPKPAPIPPPAPGPDGQPPAPLPPPPDVPDRYPDGGTPFLPLTPPTPPPTPTPGPSSSPTPPPTPTPPPLPDDGLGGLIQMIIRFITPRFSFDPNDKIGPQGAGEARYISGTEPMNYTIQFENKASANAPAQEVVITDQLDVTKFDLATFQLGPISFGANTAMAPPPGLSEWTTDIDLRPDNNLIVRVSGALDKTTGVITWRFISLDPATLQPTEDAAAGFLPPNKNAPEGDGAVLFTISAKPTLPEGTVIRNKARIVFDVNAPIDTPEWSNTIDRSPPSSEVQALAETNNSSRFQVSWGGADGTSGIESYTIFVSENGGAYTPWLTTSATTAFYQGRPSANYTFYSVATDGAGNTEAAPLSGDASTSTLAGQLLNIATRLRVQTGENVLIGGVIITGTDPKRVILRAIGPSLSGVFEGALADPVMELYQGDTLIAANDNWRDSQPGEIEATTIPPSHEFESAIVRTLGPGFYTAVMAGKDGGTGIGVVEAYDLDQAANSKLANIATRGFVDLGDNVMIGGVIAGGNGGADTRVLIRAIGPSLANAGINGSLQDPTLELRDANGALLRENDNWQADQQREIEATTIPPSNAAESAIVATLTPGNYTAIVRGKNNTTGVALVEVYNVP